MRAVFDKTGLETLLQDFYALTGLRTVVFDEWGLDILSYPKELPMYCRLIRQTPQGEQGCRLCDQRACRQAQREGGPLIYPCHAGLIEAITPIQVDDVTVFESLCEFARHKAAVSKAECKCHLFTGITPVSSIRSSFSAFS